MATKLIIDKEKLIEHRQSLASRIPTCQSPIEKIELKEVVKFIDWLFESDLIIHQVQKDETQYVTQVFQQRNSGAFNEDGNIRHFRSDDDSDAFTDTGNMKKFQD